VTVLIGAIALLLVLAIAGRFWLISQRPQETPPVTPPPPAEPAPPPAAVADPAANPPTTETPPSPPPAQTVTPPVTPAPPPQPPAAAPPPTTGTSTAKPPTVPSTTTAKPQPQTTAGRGTTAAPGGRVASPQPPVTPAPPPVAPPPDLGRASGAGETGKATEDPVKPAAAEPPANDPLVPFADVKYLSVNVRRTTDRDVVVTFGGGQLTVLSRDGGGAILLFPYRAIRRATYVSARNPKWDTSLAGPPSDLDVGSILRLSRHWLVVQTTDSYAILRLEERDVPRFLDTLQTRAGIKVERPAPGK
jgi:hypothetical protein